MQSESAVNLTANRRPAPSASSFCILHFEFVIRPPCTILHPNAPFPTKITIFRRNAMCSMHLTHAP